MPSQPPRLPCLENLCECSLSRPRLQRNFALVGACIGQQFDRTFHQSVARISCRLVVNSPLSRFCACRRPNTYPSLPEPHLNCLVRSVGKVLLFLLQFGWGSLQLPKESLLPYECPPSLGNTILALVLQPGMSLPLPITPPSNSISSISTLRLLSYLHSYYHRPQFPTDTAYNSFVASLIPLPSSLAPFYFFPSSI